MFRKTLAALIVSVFALPALAGQGGRDRQPNFERLATKLELSDEQAAEFARIMTDQRELRRSQFEALKERRDAEGPSDELREEFRQLRDQTRQSTRDALSGVLSSEQLAQFEQMMERRKRGHRGRRGERGSTEEL